MDEAQVKIITMNDENIIIANTILDHTDYIINTAKYMNNHLRDHTYFNKRQPPMKKPKKTVKRNIKITELKAIYNCTSCGYRTLQREALSKHECVSKPKVIPCTSCDFENGVMANSEGYLKCPVCTYITKTTGSLKVHMWIHLNGSPYKCKECAFSGKDLKELIKHYNDIKKFVCHCGYTTHVKLQMDGHMRSHEKDKRFCCDACGFSTSERSVLIRHIVEEHPSS